MANNGDRLDLNSMYSILGDVFNRYLNENYRSGNRSTFAQGLADLRNGWAAMQNDRKNKKDQAEYKNSMGDGTGNQLGGTLSGAIGATGNGIYGVNSMPPQPNGVGFGVDANGTYNVDINGNKTYDTQPNQSMYSGGNFDWSKVSPIPNENSAIDYWNNNQPKNTMFSGMGGGEKPDNAMNITSQTIGNNYNGRIDGQVGGLGIPQSPQGGGDGFGSVLNGFNGLFGGSGSNPSLPSNSLNNLAQSIGGQNNASANDLSKYLGNEYNRATWIQQDMANNGVTNPLISMLRYDTKIAPLIQRAREDRLKDLFIRSNNRNLSDEERMEAKLQLAGELQDPEFIDKMEYNNWKRQKERDEWDLDRISKGIKNQAAQESLENNRILSDLASAFPDGQVYKVNMGEGYEDEGLRQTNPELVQGLDIINTYARNRYGKDFTVTGGWRSKENNAKNNGHPNSHHLYGEAVDLVDSGLTPEQRDDVVRFAKAIGFNSVLYHDAGSGNHLHLALEKGTHLKGLNIGKGKTLTVNQMLGKTTKDGKNTVATPKLGTLEGIELNGVVGKWIQSEYSSEGMKPIIDTLLPVYGRYIKGGMSEDEALSAVAEHLQKAYASKLGNKWQEGFNDGNTKKILTNIYQIYKDENGKTPAKDGAPTEKKDETKNGLLPSKDKTAAGKKNGKGTPPQGNQSQVDYSDTRDIDSDNYYGEEGGGYSLHNASGDFRTNDAYGNAIRATIAQNKDRDDAVATGRYRIDPHTGRLVNIAEEKRELEERAMNNW